MNSAIHQPVKWRMVIQPGRVIPMMIMAILLISCFIACLNVDFQKLDGDTGTNSGISRSKSRMKKVMPVVFTPGTITNVLFSDSHK